MDNLSNEDFINGIEEIFKNITGLDLHNHTEEEFQEWYHNEMKKIAETDSYTREILSSAERIIETKDYSQLMAILTNYDTLVKGNDWPEDCYLPYWCYAFGLRPEEE